MSNEEHEEDAPTLDNLWGIAPEATGGAPSEEWVRRRRNMSNEYDPPPWNPPPPPPPPPYPPPPTGLILQGDVAALQREVVAARREVRVLRTLNAVLQGENTTLRAALDASRLPHAVGCLTVVNPAYPCSCVAGPHNARIDAVLETDH